MSHQGQRQIRLEPPFGRSRHSGEVRYKRAPVPVHFPEEALVPEGKTPLVLRAFLFQLLRFALGPDHSVGSEQFVYFNAADPRKCLAPDAFVKLRVPDEPFPIWKTWERGGPPELAIEIVSPTEGTATSEWADKLASYLECGVNELVRFDPAADEGERLRVWDRVEDDLVERIVVGDQTPCTTLDLSWIVVPLEGEPVGLRLARDDGSLVLNAVETAEAHVRELEAEVRRLRGG